MFGNRIILSKRLTMELAQCSESTTKALVRRGMFKQADALVDGQRVCKGFTFESVAGYYGWSRYVQDQIFARHGVDPATEGRHFLTARGEE